MGYNVSKPPFNLAEFLSQKAPKRPLKRRMPYPYSRGSEAPQAPEAAQADDVVDAAKAGSSSLG